MSKLSHRAKEFCKILKKEAEKPKVEIDIKKIKGLIYNQKTEDDDFIKIVRILFDKYNWSEKNQNQRRISKIRPF